MTNARGQFSQSLLHGFHLWPPSAISFLTSSQIKSQTIDFSLHLPKKVNSNTTQKISDVSDVSRESIQSPKNLGPSAKKIIIYLNMNKLLIIVLLIALSISTRLQHLGDSPCYRFDEGPKGSRCSHPNECDGLRTCSQGWCQGRASRAWCNAWSRWLFVIICVLMTSPFVRLELDLRISNC